MSETAVLERLFPRLPAAETALVGPGDDAAVLTAPDGRFVVSTDMMIHGPDFRLAWSSPFELGWKAAATNLSDIAAMGATPTALVVAIAAPGATEVSTLEGIADGLREACSALSPGCGVVGGDLSVSDTLSIVVTVFGDLGGRPPVLRSGARVGDVVAHAGALGEAAAGLALLFQQAVDASGDPDAGRAAALRIRETRLIEAQLRPRPPIAAGVAAADAGATAMLDVSDGLAFDAARLARASAVGIDLASAALNAGTEADLAAAGRTLDRLLGGGEDHGLLATFPSDALLPDGFRAIGIVTPDAGTLLVDGVPRIPSGWDPYSGWDGATG